MDWTPGGSDQDIEDRRGESGGGGGGLRIGGLGGGLGLGGILILGVLSLIFRQDFLSMFMGGGATAPAPSRSSGPVEQSAAEKQRYEFVKFVLNDVQNTWDNTLQRSAGVSYRHAKLVLFRDQIPSGCGEASSAIGPFYCPADEKFYLDMTFFDELGQRLGAPGEFAQAYVLAHEAGHHIQKILGIESKVRRLQRQDPGARNPLSVRMELQADCLAGVWGHSTRERRIINERDIEQGMAGAAAVGDDRLQKMARGSVNTESFTHGSSAQRVEWFRRGLESGEVSACNTFDSR